MPRRFMRSMRAEWILRLSRSKSVSVESSLRLLAKVSRPAVDSPEEGAGVVEDEGPFANLNLVAADEGVSVGVDVLVIEEDGGFGREGARV